MGKLLDEGGKIIYVAPSGGRDRPDNNGKIKISPLDPQSIEIFNLIARKSKAKTHFYTLALSTYQLMPPPKIIQVELGEKRLTKYGAIHLAFGNEINMDKFNNLKKQDRKIKLTEHIWTLIKKDYKKISKGN